MASRVELEGPAVLGGPAPERDRGGDDGGLAPLRARVETALRETLEGELSEAPPAVAEAIRYTVLGPGKRVRPLVLVASWRAAGGSGLEPLRLSTSVELVHAYSLIHDDLPCMDDDSLRRGRPAAHVRFGVEPAVLVGASLMPLATAAVWRGGEELGLSAERVRGLLSILSRAAGGEGMVGGQLRDLQAEGRPISREDVERIHEGKTASLIAAAARMGAVAARGPAPVVERLARFGWRLGLAFQAVDDLLDVKGSVRETGKPCGRDGALRKATFPRVLGLEEAERVTRDLAGQALAEVEGMERAAELRELVALAVDRRR